MDSITIIVELPENYRHDHFDLTLRIKSDMEDWQKEIATLRGPTAELQASLDSQDKPT